MQTREIPPDVRLMRLPEVVATAGLSKSEIYRRISASRFPAGHRRSHRVTVWLSNEVQAWVRSQVATMKPVFRDGEEDLIG